MSGYYVHDMYFDESAYKQHEETLWELYALVDTNSCNRDACTLILNQAISANKITTKDAKEIWVLVFGFSIPMLKFQDNNLCLEE